jgi:phage-related tail protein
MTINVKLQQVGTDTSVLERLAALEEIVEKQAQTLKEYEERLEITEDNVVTTNGNLSGIRWDVSQHENSIGSLSNELRTLAIQLGNFYDRITPVVKLTQAQYDTLEAYDGYTLYVIVG